MSKGDRRERQACEIYQQAGFATYRPATVRYGENDIFGLFDILAVSPSHGSVHGVQVKSNRATGINDWADHTRLWRNLGWRTFYAVPVDREGWRFLEPAEDEHGNSAILTCVDERKHNCNMGDVLAEYLQSE